MRNMALKRAVTKVAVLAGVAGAFMAATPAHADTNITNITNGAGGVVSGNQVGIPVNAPISVCSLSVPIFGFGVSGCRGGAGVVFH